MKRYNPTEIEPKWQRIWDETAVYSVDFKSQKPKYVAMGMFNYPSGAGIHIGHAMNYTISDVKARFKRQSGYESYNPVGWDAFGLPAENYAIKSGVSPQASMAQIIPGYHKQYKAMGWSNDWGKEIATHLPEYYRWTQWIFTQMFNQDLAYQDSRMQWWCNSCQTVLANEQIVDGKCWRHDSPDDPLVEKKEVKQWFFKITDYADELLEAIDDLDWTETVKLAQRNWIGKSVGAEINFAVQDNDHVITVFTTRPDTLYGATFLVVAPEYPGLLDITSSEQQIVVADYMKQAQQKSELERQTSKQKTGVFTGAYARNPISGSLIPVWTADYVLDGYGTGAIMAVPAHDERDHEFAQSFNLPIIRVVANDAADDACTHEEGTLIASGDYTGMATQIAREQIVAELAEKGLAVTKTNFKMRDWSVSRQRYWGAPIPIIRCPEHGNVLVPENQLPVTLPELTDFQPSGDGRSALARATEWLQTTCPICDGPAERETDTLDTYICSSWYMYRYLDPTNATQIFDPQQIAAWEPIDFYNGADHATAHLLYARFIGHFFHKQGLVTNPEPFKQFLFNGKVTASDGTMFSKSKGNGVDPLEIINQGYGADALRTYLMFAAPLELWAKWDPQGVPGTHRFLSRIWTLVQEYLEAPEGSDDPQARKQLRFATHTMIKKMSEDIEHNRYNTAIAAAMTAVNELYKLKVDNLVQSTGWREALLHVVACIAPFAPHIADELWQQLGNERSVQLDSWPVHNPDYLVADTISVAVQIQGKLRGQLAIAADADQATVIAAAKALPAVAKHLEGNIVKKEIYVPGKIVNFVI